MIVVTNDELRYERDVGGNDSELPAELSRVGYLSEARDHCNYLQQS